MLTDFGGDFCWMWGEWNWLSVMSIGGLQC